jgi:hypothetical protein
MESEATVSETKQRESYEPSDSEWALLFVAAGYNDAEGMRQAVRAIIENAQAAADEVEPKPLCRIPGCTQPAWPTFDGVCFDHGMFPETVPT